MYDRSHISEILITDDLSSSYPQHLFPQFHLHHILLSRMKLKEVRDPNRAAQTQYSPEEGNNRGAAVIFKWVMLTRVLLLTA